MFRRIVLFICLAATALRLFLFLTFPGLVELLSTRVEVATPVTSFKRLREGVFLFNNGISPYDGGVFHQAPLFLAIFSLIPDNIPVIQPSILLFIGADLISAVALMRIWRSGMATTSRRFTSPRKDTQWSDIAVAVAFLFNPITVAACIGRTTSVFANCAAIHAIAFAVEGDLVSTGYTLALAAYSSMSFALLVPPLALLTYDAQATKKHPAPNPVAFTGSFVAVFSIAAGVLLMLSLFVVDFDWTFLNSTYGFELLLTDLTPNIGLWWYFFTEMFDSFRGFFLGVFWLHMSSYVATLTIRLKNQPLLAVTSLLGIFAIFKPYPSIADVSLYFALLPLFRHIFPLLRYGFIAAAVLLYAAFLGPAFWHLWIYAGSGNANFFYAITLVWSLGMAIVVADTIFAGLRDELDAERPELRGKDVRQI